MGFKARKSKLDFFSQSAAKSTALGWPNCCRLIDGHPDDKDPQAAALRLAGSRDPLYFVDVPRLTAYRFLHIMTIPKRRKHWKTKVPAAASRQAVPGQRDLARFLAGYMPSMELYRFHAQTALFLHEALLGTEVVVDAFLHRLDSLPASAWKIQNPNNILFWLVHSFGYLLLRLPLVMRRAAVKRLRGLIADRAPTSLLHERIDIVTGGARALRRFVDDPQTPLECDYESPKVQRQAQLRHASLLCDFCDDPLLVREVAMAWPARTTTLRAVWLGGPETLDGDVDKRLRGLAAWRLRHIVSEIGVVRDPRVIPIMAALVANRASRSAALEWFATHRNYASSRLAALEREPGSVGKGATLARKHLAGEARSSAAHRLSPAQLDRELSKISKGLTRTLKRVRGNSKKEQAAIAAAIDAYIEAQTAALATIPSAYVMHFLCADHHNEAPPPLATVAKSDAEYRRWNEMALERLEPT